MSKENKRLFQTIFISGIATVFSYLINFLLTPYISNHVGIEAYGYYSSFDNFYCSLYYA